MTLCSTIRILAHCLILAMCLENTRAHSPQCAPIIHMILHMYTPTLTFNKNKRQNTKTNTKTKTNSNQQSRRRSIVGLRCAPLACASSARL